MILHVDMDAFYASVEERDRPELVGKPVIVGGTPEGRGVVAAANYVARKFGVHSAMPAVAAKRLCPRGVFLRPRIEYYAEISDQIRAIFENYTPLVEPLSLDEAFLDVTGSEPLFGPAVSIGRAIKQEIRAHLRLVASVGVAPNKFLAKIASDLNKPDGFVVVQPAHVQEFLDPLPVSRLWGVGKVTGSVLEKLGVHRIGQLRQMPVESLRHHFGGSGDHLWELSHGVDQRPVVPEQEAQSISHETTFAKDLDDREAMRAWLLELSEQVGCRLRRHRLKGRTVHLKVRFEDFHTITRAKTLPQATNVTQEIWQTAAQIFAERLPARRLHVRLLGVGMSGLDQPGLLQLNLFPKADHERQSRLDEVADRVKEKFGQASLQRALGMLHNVEHKSGLPGLDQNQ
ncbi:MAG: DNA polymerase IV [Planctomycetes bacterium RBG_16_64_10]|nr:MAG: DNA polymerase IV [Planctomycetes bacterium RBG_16_64_10]